MSQAHQTDPEASAAQPAVPAPPVGRPETLSGVGVYQLLAPLLVGRTVLELWPLLADGRSRLEQAGAGEVVCLSPEEPSLPLADASIDVVLCLAGFGPRPRSEQGAWLTELRRVLQPEGLTVFRMQCDGEDLGPEDRVLLVGEGGPPPRVVKETPFVGVSFFAPDTEDMAIAGDLGRLAASPTHHLLLLSRAPEPTWRLPESLFIPLDDLRADLSQRAAWEKQLHAERDDLRETAMTLQDQLDRREAALAAFRRRSARRLEETSDLQATLEALTLERDLLEKRAQRAEKAVTDLEVATRRRDVTLAAQDAELTRLRARPPARPEKSPPDPQPPQKNKPPA